MGDKQKKLSPAKPKHEVGKRLMSEKGLVTGVDVPHPLTHKAHVVEVIESIIKDTKMEPCAEQSTKELGTSGLFDLAQVRHFHFSFFLLLNS